MRTTFKPYQKYSFFKNDIYVASCPCCGEPELRVTSVVIPSIRNEPPFAISAYLTYSGFAFFDQIPERYESFPQSTDQEKVTCSMCGWTGELIFEGTQEHYDALKKCGKGFREYLEDLGLDPDKICQRPKCPNENNDGEGYDGFCGSCADKGYGERTSG